ncbi:uncharacterized protein C7orf50 homolog isoform X2 [Tachysurus fulvidraco]|uniref:uncharacterized protein C7orf50 homolog isoform X2 n=1 Tax=Tachysurus fulvidraco TaxID=1234273 RepID=UPI001FEE3B75|nr:uncharacterized protein C7orf50 homolog isoform X2 [Tachysurus fulvidraco]
MKRKNTEMTLKVSEQFDPIIEVKKKNKKKKKGGDIDSTDTFDATDECKNEDLEGKEESEGCEAVSCAVKKKKKKVKKEKDATVDIAEAADLAESRTNEELNKKKKEAHQDKHPVITERVEEEEGTEDEDDEELSPEERRVLERKLKKIRKKEEKKKQKEIVKSEKEESKSSIAQTQALDYLTCWSEKRDEWKFQKTRQVWLLQHMYDREKVPDAHFSVLLSYLEGLRGVARDITVQKAEALVRFGAGPEDEEGVVTESQRKTQRARDVVQILS